MSTPPTQYFSLSNFTFQDGTTLEPQLAYRIINPTATQTALIPTCFRGRLDSTLTFAHSALKHYRIVLVSLFGNGESPSPSNCPNFPRSLDYRDCVRAQYQLLRHLHIPRLDLMLGFSMAGQCTYYMTTMYPDLVRHAVVICSSARTSLHNYQFLEGPKAALENAVDYADRASTVKETTEAGTASRGLRAFGKAYSAWLTSAEWFEERRFEQLGFNSLAEWDAVVAGSNYLNWDPEDLLIMLRMWQGGDIGVCVSDEHREGGREGREAVEEALQLIRAGVLVMPCRTDQYFRWEAGEREARILNHARLQVIPSIWGHLAGAGANQEDVQWMDDRIVEYLTGGDSS